MARIKNLPRRAVLVLESESVEVEQIGRGQFTVAFRAIHNPNDVYLQVDSDNDASKELLARIEGTHIPQLERIDELNGKDLYKSRFYLPLTAKSGEAWKQFRELSRLSEQAWKETQPTYNQERDMWRSVEHFSSLVAESELPQSLREDIASICNWAGCYGRAGYGVEIAKRNLAVDENGTLILLDPVYDWAFIQDQHKKRSKRWAA